MKEVDRITIARWFDRHLHLRDGNMMKAVLPCTLEQRATGAIIMPNLFKIGTDGELVKDKNGKPIPDPVDSINKAKAYRNRITALLGGSDFEPCLALYLTDHTSPDEVVEGFKQGLWRAVKLYMADQQGEGGTTGSQHGVRNLESRKPVFKKMEEHGIPLLCHAEAVEQEVDEFDREIRSLDRDIKPITKEFPSLPVVIEHITDGRVAEFVAETDRNVYATVTAHHLVLNRNDMFRGGMNPINYCKPVPKREEERFKVRKYVTSGHPRFGAGTDSAPHDVSAKAKCCGCAAGIFTARDAVELYTTVFDEDNARDHLEAFLSTNLLPLYGMKKSKETMTIVKTPHTIPEEVGGVRVFKGGETIPWKLVA